MPTPNKTYRILVIEDNPTDVNLIGQALTKHGVEHKMVVLTDGEKALQYLDKLDSVPIPALIILDINMPKRDGLAVLVRYRMNI